MAHTQFERYVTERFMRTPQGQCLSYQSVGNGRMNITVKRSFLEGYAHLPAMEPIDQEASYTLDCRFEEEPRGEKIEIDGHQGVAEAVASAMVRELETYRIAEERLSRFNVRMPYLLLSSIFDQHEEWYRHSNPVHKYLFDPLITREICTFLDVEDINSGPLPFWHWPLKIYMRRGSVSFLHRTFNKPV
jgi:hypothetical protein